MSVVNYQDVARLVARAKPKWAEIEDDVALSAYVKRTQGIELTLIEAELVRIAYDDFEAEKKFYNIPVFGCVEPSLAGPYQTPEDRLAAAKAIHAKQDVDDALFWLDIDFEREPTVGAFLNTDFEEPTSEATIPNDADSEGGEED